MNKTKPPVSEYYDRYQFVDWFRKHKKIDLDPWLTTYASKVIDANNDTIIDVGDFLGSFDEEDAAKHGFDLQAMQNAFNEVFGEGKSIELKYWW